MIRDIHPSIALADFDDVTINYKDVELETRDKQRLKIAPSIHLFKKEDEYFVTLIDKDNSENNQTYPVLHVLGGNWNQHFDAKVGDVLFPTPMQWIIKDKQWLNDPFSTIWWVADGTEDGRPKMPTEMPTAKASGAQCDGCHKTNFNPTKNERGQWTDHNAEFGITCEKCHGPGSEHIVAQGKGKIINPAALSAVQQGQLCGSCHSRLTSKMEKELAYPLGYMSGDIDLHERVMFWNFASNPRNYWPNEFSRKNRQQYQDSLLSIHQEKGVTCITCHNVHSTGKNYAQLRSAKEKLCEECHAASSEMFIGSVMAESDVICTDCHMAKIGSRSGTTEKVKEHWDVSSHTFKVVTPFIAEQNKMRSSCVACHEESEQYAKGATMLDHQSAVKKKIEDVTQAIANHKKNGKTFPVAQELLNKVVADKSLGFHNPDKTLHLLDEALDTLE